VESLSDGKSVCRSDTAREPKVGTSLHSRLHRIQETGKEKRFFPADAAVLRASPVPVSHTSSAEPQYRVKSEFLVAKPDGPADSNDTQQSQNAPASNKVNQ
jgi:hypothetical protein